MKWSQVLTADCNDLSCSLQEARRVVGVSNWEGYGCIEECCKGGYFTCRCDAVLHLGHEGLSGSGKPWLSWENEEMPT